MELLLQLRLQVLAFDTSVAALAHRAVELVVVPLAVRVVIDNVEVSGLERLLTSFAHEAVFMVAAGETAIGGADRLSLDDLSTTSTFAFVCSRWASNRIRHIRALKGRCWRRWSVQR